MLYMNDLQKIDKKIKDSSNNISAMCKFIKYANVVSPTIFAIAIEQTLSEFDFFEPIGLCFKYILIFLVGIC